MNSPLISVIIPTYNRAYTLKQTIESVTSQTYQDFEIIIVDDGSTDETKELVDSLKSDQRIHYYHQNNKGVSAARNYGVSLSSAKYVSFLDSDDSWLPHKLEEQVKFFEENPQIRWVHTEEIWIRNGVRVNQMKKHKKGGGDQFLPSLKLCFISPSTVMIERELYNEFKGFREDFAVCEDYDLWLRLLYKFPVGFIEEPLIQKYGGHEDQLSSKFFAMDYWRIKTLAWLLMNYQPEGERLEQILRIGLKKAKVLLKGYIKHNNLDNYKEIETIQSLFLEH